MPEGLVIRESSYDHADAVELTEMAQDYYRQIYGGPDSSPIDAQEFTPPRGAFLIGYLEGQAVAMGGWRFLTEGQPTEVTRPTEAVRPVEIKRMFVRHQERGLGIGSRILRELEARAVESGADWALLQTGQPQVDAVALYRRSGYREVTPFGFFACMPDAVHLGRLLP